MSWSEAIIFSMALAIVCLFCEYTRVRDKLRSTEDELKRYKKKYGTMSIYELLDIDLSE